MHHPKLYFLHKLHHSYTAPFSFSGLFSSHFEFIVVGSIPLTLGPLFLGMSLFSTLVWLSLRTFYSVEIHSGYDIGYENCVAVFLFKEFKICYHFMEVPQLTMLIMNSLTGIMVIVLYFGIDF